MVTNSGNGGTWSDRLMEFIRAIVRPILTVGTLGTTFYIIITIPDVPDRVFTWLTVQSATLLTWWFADRSKRE